MKGWVVELCLCFVAAVTGFVGCCEVQGVVGDASVPRERTIKRLIVVTVGRQSGGQKRDGTIQLVSDGGCDFLSTIIMK